jgi:hypothetical protein
LVQQWCNPPVTNLAGQLSGFDAREGLKEAQVVRAKYAELRLLGWRKKTKRILFAN